MKLKDKITIVTGASRGIGRAIAVCMAAEGATVICNYAHNTEKAEAVVKQIEDACGTAMCYQADIKNFAAVEKMVQDIIQKYERVDILVNNAGVTNDDLILSMTDEAWKEVLETNLYGTFHCTKAVAQQMMFQKKGRIINISSVAGERGGRGQSNYAASKGGVNAFTRAAAVELAPKKITVNAVAPGVIETEMSQEVLRRAKEIVMNHIPLKRLGTADEVAETVVFLASDEAAYITGQVFNVDGGFRG
ncbi:MAG: 3-oxoacyl-[acyl-carrier-protein] reductase [Deltaproteobacteria bacterium]|nr:3-oxoacyl-[acyl-carrier-protein] reductase [Deltaproteobacteria bacterium]